VSLSLRKSFFVLQLWNLRNKNGCHRFCGHVLRFARPACNYIGACGLRKVTGPKGRFRELYNLKERGVFLRKVQVLERLPYRATAQSAAYDHIARLPVFVLLDNVRSAYNVGAFFRTADAAGIEKLYLSGITGKPPAKAITKTALGAEETVAWEHTWDALPVLDDLRARGVQIAAIETTPSSVDIFEWVPRFPVCVIFGHEVDGLRPEVGERADVHIRIPMLGRKHSLNVATAGGVVMYELLRKYRAAGEITG
jgi:tRNA G18 (ribose-2'-O)-methylase SpoU